MEIFIQQLVNSLSVASVTILIGIGITLIFGLAGIVNFPRRWPRKHLRVYDPNIMIYSTLIRPLAFRLDPETAHHLAIAAGARLGWAARAMRAATRIDDDRLATDVAGLHFPSPIGLAAGFDKSGSAISALAGLGFGSIEIGSLALTPLGPKGALGLLAIGASDADRFHPAMSTEFLSRIGELVTYALIR